MAIINVVKYRKYKSPVYSASKAVGLAAACVSMLTLESTMLTTFSDGTMSFAERKILLGSSGDVISAFIIGMAIYMIVQSSKKRSCWIQQRSKSMENKKSESFNYTYSAKQQEEIKAIRQKYMAPEENKMEQLRRLDVSVTRKATIRSMTAGIIGALIMGLGMSITMTDIGAVFGSFLARQK